MISAIKRIPFKGKREGGNKQDGSHEPGNRGEQKHATCYYNQ